MNCRRYSRLLLSNGSGTDATTNHAARRSRTCNSRFLRPLPLPLGYCGVLISRRSRPGRASLQNAASRIRTCTTALLGRGPLPVGLPQQCLCSQVHRISGRRRELNPHFPGANRKSCQLDDGPVECCEKDSNLHPRPSEGRAHPVELPQRFLSPMIQAGFEPAPGRF